MDLARRMVRQINAEWGGFKQDETDPSRLPKPVFQHIYGVFRVAFAEGMTPLNLPGS
jgi:hypothetical protein